MKESSASTVYSCSGYYATVSIIQPSEVCDFCLAPDPRFVHLSLIFFLPGDPNYQEADGEWGACEVCHHLILAEDLTGLIGRLSVDDVDDSPRGRAYHERVVRGFWDYRTKAWVQE